MIDWRKKTMKREFSLMLLIVLLYVVIFGNVAMVEAIVWPFLSFVATSAGLTIYDRKVPDERRDP